MTNFHPLSPLALMVLTVAGLLAGSFLTVVIARVPTGASVVAPRSACPRCSHQLRWWENMPVVSWVVLRGRCRQCRVPISVRYPLVEILTAAIWVVLAARVGITQVLPAFLAVGAVGLALAMIDLETFRLPNPLMAWGYGLALTLLVLAAVLTSCWSCLGRSLLAGLVMIAVYVVIIMIYPAGMGMGDAKLAGLVGIALGWLGWNYVVIGSWLAFFSGSFVGIIVIATKRGGRKTGIPFGPHIALSALAGIVWTPPLWSVFTLS